MFPTPNTQAGFFFDAPLLNDPAPLIAPPPTPAPAAGILLPADDSLVETARAVIATMPDDLDYDEVLDAIGLHPLSRTGWHRARVMEALLVSPDGGEFQAYKTDAGKIRFRRLPPLMPCPGFEEIECNRQTRGGVRCETCRNAEEEDRWNEEDR
jgi:hypothetical protein